MGFFYLPYSKILLGCFPAAGVTTETLQAAAASPDPAGGEGKIQEEEHDLVDDDMAAGER